jgi:formate dehydrogenase major subunit
MNAERGHANIQGNTDHAISWDILPGYLRIPRRARSTSTTTWRRARARSWRPDA